MSRSIAGSLPYSFFAVCTLWLVCFAGACSTEPSPDNNPAPSTTPAQQPQSPTLAPNTAYIVVDLEECAQNLGKNTGKEHKALGTVLQLSRDQYVEFMRKDLYTYRSGGYASAQDAVTIKCAIRLLDYLNQMAPEKKQWMADLYMASYKTGYEGK